jgi:hypothetical protein
LGPARGVEPSPLLLINEGNEWTDIGMFLQGHLHQFESFEVIEVYAHHSYNGMSNLPMTERELLRVCDPNGHTNALFQKLRGSGHDAVIHEWTQRSHFEHRHERWGPIAFTTISWWKLTFRKGSKMPMSEI